MAAMKIGVELRISADAGELFADARALEAAGADSFWAWLSVDGDDPWTVLAAIAAHTWRSRLILVDGIGRPDTRRTLERLSHGRLVVAEADGEKLTVASGEGDPERWSRVGFPAGREAWLALMKTEATDGLILQNDPRLLDLLRNPDVILDRSDIKLAQG